VARRRGTRFSPAEQKEFEECERRLAKGSARSRRSAMRRLGELAEIADSYDLLPSQDSSLLPDVSAFRSVWREAEAMRRSGALARALRRVRAPVVVLHGREDPHPVEGVVEPMIRAGLDVRVVVFERCGHEPWRERYARTKFFEVLNAELARGRGSP
jgi:pimeloyl-ACP methyl ester carboxylesterase